MTGRENGPATWDQTSLEELRRLRRDAVHLAEQNETAATESRRQAEVYASAAVQLSKKAEETGSNELTQKAEENAKKSDQRRRTARHREEEASKQRAIAMRLNAFIDRRETEPGR